MFRKLKFLVKDTLLYGISSAFSRSLSLITFPLLAQTFSIAEFGKFDLLTSLATLISTLLIFGMDSSIVRFYYEYTDDLMRKQIISQALIFQVVMALILLPIIWLLGPSLIPSLQNGSDERMILNIILVQLPFQVMLSNAQVILQYSYKRLPFIILTVGSSIATVITYAVGILYFDFVFYDIFISSLLINIFFSALGIYFIKNWFVLTSKLSTLKFLLPYAIPMGIIVALNSFQPYFERAIISKFLDINSLGMYAAGYKVGTLILLPISAFQAAWSPFMMSNYKKENSGELFNIILKLLTFIVATIVIVLTILSSTIVRSLAGMGYISGEVVVFPIAMGYLFQAVALFTGMGTVLAQKTYIRLISYVVSICLTAVIIFLTIRSLGILGVALAVLSGQLCKCVLESFFGQRIITFPWQYKRIAMAMALTLIAGFTLSSFNESALNSLSMKLPILVVYIFFTYFLLFTKSETSQFLNLAAKLRKGR
ncbi:MAG: lipopolysaccharide biosynthesis protein [Daejeonella sp.]